MTCVVGLAQGGSVYMGADSGAVTGPLGFACTQPKAFRKGPLLLGAAGLMRLPNLLEHLLEVPPDTSGSAMEYVVTQLVPQIQEVLQRSGFGGTGPEGDGYPAIMLVGYRGRLFHIDCGYAVVEPRCRYMAIGSGGDLALGALHAILNGPSPYPDPRDTLLAALSAAGQFCEGVRPPFRVLKLKGAACEEGDVVPA